MGSVDFTLLDAVLPQNLQKRLVRQFAAPSRLLSMIPVVRSTSGHKMQFIADLGGKATHAVADGYDVQAEWYDANEFVKCSADLAHERAQARVTRDAQSAGVFAMGGASELANPSQEALVQCLLQLGSKLDSEVINGAGSGNRCVGLKNSIVTSGSPYGVDVAAKTKLQGQVQTTVGTLTPAKLAELEEAIFADTEQRPNVIVMAPDVMTKLSSDGYLQDSRRYMNNAPMDLGVAPDSFTFQGIPCLRSNSVGSGELYMLNTNFIRIEWMYDASADNDAVILDLMQSLGGPAGIGELSPSGFPVICYSVAKRGSAKEIVADTPAFNIANLLPAAHGRMTGITV